MVTARNLLNGFTVKPKYEILVKSLKIRFSGKHSRYYSLNISLEVKTVPGTRHEAL